MLLKTIKDLESDPGIDPRDPAFVNLKCALLQRVLELENDTAHAEAVIHVVDSSRKQEHAPGREEDDSAIA